MRCNNCMKELKEDLEICPYCGQSPLIQNPDHKNSADAEHPKDIKVGKPQSEVNDEREKHTGRSSKKSMYYNWQPVSSTHTRSRAKKTSTKKLMLIAVALTCVIVIIFLIIANKNNDSKSGDEIATVVATTAPKATEKPENKNKENTTAPVTTSSDKGNTQSTKSGKSALEYANSLDLSVDGHSPESHMKDNSLILEYYFSGDSNSEDEAEFALFNDYRQRLGLVINYLENQLKSKGYSVSSISVEGYDSVGTQFFHETTNYNH